MSIVEDIDFIGLKDVIKKCFTSVFSDLNIATETWFQKSKLLTIGRNKYADYITKNVGIFPLFATNRSVFVDDAYVSLFLSKELEREKYRSIKDIEAEIIIHSRGGEDYRKSKGEVLTPIEALEKSRNGFALIGNAGSGKTTALKYIAIQAAKGKKIRKKKIIPIYLAVRDMALKKLGVKQTIIELFQMLEISQEEKVLNSLLKSGKCIILIDGLDETDRSHRDIIIKEILELKSKYNNNIFCVSSRPFGIEVGLTGFEKWETLPLSLEERKSFVNKWFSEVDELKGKQLLEKCENRSEILDIGSNPLLLSMVCALYYNDLDIPEEPDELFARAIEGIMGRWDAFRNIARDTLLAEFSIRKRILLVNWLAAVVYEEKKILFSKKDIEKTDFISKTSSALRMEIPETVELLNTLYNDFGLLVEKAPGLYSFSHLSLQDYCVAQFIVDNRKEINFLKSSLDNYDVHFNNSDESIILLVAKLLTNADNYLKVLLDFVNKEFRNIYLLLKVLEIKPMCSKNIIRKVLLQFLLRMDISISLLKPKIKFKDSELIFELIHKKRLQRKKIKNSLSNKYKYLVDASVSEYEAYIIQYIIEFHKNIVSMGYNINKLEVRNRMLKKLIQKININQLQKIEFKMMMRK